MTFEEAIKTAIEMERKVQGVYAHASREAADQVGKRIFSMLASEEANHVKYLERRLLSWKESGKVELESLATALPDAGLIKEEVAKLKENMAGVDRGKELQLLESARAVEADTSAFYETAVSQLTGDEQAFFERFVEIERGHLALVEAEISALDGMGFWFDMPEFNLENA